MRVQTTGDRLMEKSRSPYQRHNKTPYRYSAELRGWREAIKRNDATEAAHHLRAWERKYSPRNNYYRTLLTAAE